MTRLVVLGGSGFLGARVVEGLRRAGLDAAVASRRAKVAVDVTAPKTFSALEPFAVVVDLTDTVSHPPDALVAWCLERGKTVLEATSEAPCVERLHRAHRDGPGRLVLGGGIFTGLSNLLARAVAVPGTKRLTLGVASSPFSGAGQGTIELMLRAMALPVVRFESGTRVERHRMERGPVLDFGDRRRPTGAMSLAEPYMLRESTGAPDVAAYFAPKPSVLVRGFLAVPPAVARAGWYQAAMRAYFTVLRRFLLRRVSSAVELVAEADGRRRWLHATDGMEAAGLALAAMIEAVAPKRDWTGARFIDDLCALEPIVERVKGLAGVPLIRLSEGEAQGAGEAPRRSA